MTCIVAVSKGGDVWMAGDLMGSNGFTKRVYKDSKVFVNGDFILGYTDSFRMGQILEYCWSQPPRAEGMTDKQYLHISVIPSMKEVLITNGFGSSDGREDIGGNFLIGYNGQIYEMQCNFSILRHEEFAAVGSGEFHAIGALEVLYNSDTHPEDMVVEAIRVASKYVTSVSEECTVVTTSVDDRIEELTRDELKEIAKQTGIKFTSKTSTDKLRALVKEKVDEQS